MLNVLVLMGRITKDPISRKVGETTIVNFDIAVDNVRKEADGSRGTTFLPVVCFANLAENAEKYLVKGSKVVLRGSIQQRNFIRKDGTKGTAYEVIADALEFLDNKKLGMESTEEVEQIPDEMVEEHPEPVKEKYDPYTGKPLKSSKK